MEHHVFIMRKRSARFDGNAFSCHSPRSIQPKLKIKSSETNNGVRDTELENSAFATSFQGPPKPWLRGLCIRHFRPRCSETINQILLPSLRTSQHLILHFIMSLCALLLFTEASSIRKRIAIENIEIAKSRDNQNWLIPTLYYLII